MQVPLMQINFYDLIKQVGGVNLQKKMDSTSFSFIVKKLIRLIVVVAFLASIGKSKRNFLFIYALTARGFPPQWKWKEVRTSLNIFFEKLFLQLECVSLEMLTASLTAQFLFLVLIYADATYIVNIFEYSQLFAPQLDQFILQARVNFNCYPQTDIEENNDFQMFLEKGNIILLSFFSSWKFHSYFVQ